jgi:hypothetical protein
MHTFSSSLFIQTESKSLAAKKTPEKKKAVLQKTTGEVERT